MLNFSRCQYVEIDNTCFFNYLTLSFFLETKLSRNYAEPHVNGVSSHNYHHHHPKTNGIVCNGKSRSSNHSEYNNSIRSVETENTYVPSFPPSSIMTTTAYIENGGGSSSNGGSSQVSLLNGHSPNGSGITLDTSNYDEFFDDYLSASTGVLEFDDNSKLIFQGEEGRVSLQI